MSGRLRWLVVAGIAAVLAVEVALAIAAGNAPMNRPGEPASSPRLAVGTLLDKRLGRLRLIDEHGRPTSLAAFRGRYLVLAPSLTLCHEVCPLTTGALMRLQRLVRDAGLGDRVTVAEATVDPWRDSPARVRAFKRRTGADVRFLTGTEAQIRRLWRALGVEFHRVAQGHPPDRDWWTHRPERFDVTHTDGVFIIDPRGRWRVAVPGMPITAGRLPARLASLLNQAGRRNLRHPDTPWNPEAILDDLRALMGLPASAAGTARGGVPDERRSPRELTTLRAEADRLLNGGAPAARARIRRLRGHPLVINAWASWCPPCGAEMRLLAGAASRFDRRVGFLGLNVDDSEGSARRFLAEHPVGYPSYADPGAKAVSALASFVGLPTTLFLDADGVVRSVHTGQYTDAASLERDIRRYAHD